jgi:hypothetical protein
MIRGRAAMRLLKTSRRDSSSSRLELFNATILLFRSLNLFLVDFTAFRCKEMLLLLLSTRDNGECCQDLCLDNTGAINKREFTAALEEHAVNATDSCKNSTNRRIVSEFIIVTGAIIVEGDATMMSIRM